MKKILVTGGNSRFVLTLKKIKTSLKFIYTTKNDLNITSRKDIKKNIKKYKPDYILHVAGLSRPLKQHETDIQKSIFLNIIGTSNLVIECSIKKVKLIYLSSSYIYQGKKGNYKETDPVLPWSNYGWSKLGGESAVQMYNNSLILRCCMTEKPFLHKAAYSNVKTNFAYQEDIAKNLIKVIHKKGIFNLGGKSQTIFDFAKKENKMIKKKISRGEFPFRQDMSLSKIEKILKK
jgi:dTDP-4-dehydrorhamnose reductase